MLRKVSLHALRFIHFDRAGVRFLFCYTDLDESVEDGLAFYLEFSRQIIDSNLLHAALFPPYCPVGLRLHSVLFGEDLPVRSTGYRPLTFYLFSPGSSSSGMFSFSVVGRSCVVTSATSASGASSMPSTTSASKYCPDSTRSSTLSEVASASSDRPSTSPDCPAESGPVALSS